MNNNLSYFKNCGDDCPAENLAWIEAKDFIEKLNQMEKTDMYRLPTEAEWEYACRAGSDTPFANGHSPDEMGWYKKNAYDGTHPVAMKKPNDLGLYDMHGNVWEWCENLCQVKEIKEMHYYKEYNKFYEDKKRIISKTFHSTGKDPFGRSDSESYRIFRGGSWLYDESHCRSANRDADNTWVRMIEGGLRVVKDL